MMEYSPLYTRHLSGSSSRNSFNDDAWEQLEFNINDISRASSPASVVSVSARSEGHGAVFRDRRHRNSTRGDEEYRRKYAKMKAELDVERMKARQLQQDRVAEMRRLREAFENDRKLEIAAMQHRLEEEKKKEVAKLKEDLIKQKDFELQQVLMYKESERRQQRQQSPNPHLHQPLSQQPKQQEYKGTKIEEGKEKHKKIEDEKLEKNEAEEDYESGGGKDGDNDVAMVSEKGRGKVSSSPERRRRRTNNPGESRDGGAYDIRHGSRTVKTTHSQDEFDGDSESGVEQKRRGGSVSKMVERIEKGDISMGVDSDTQASETATDNTASKSMSTSTKDTTPAKKDAVTNTVNNRVTAGGKSGHSGSKETAVKQKMKDHQTQTADQTEKSRQGKKKDHEKDSQKEEMDKQEDVKGETEKEKEKELLVKQLQQKVEELESMKSSLVQQKQEVEHKLETKCKEHKAREEEFMTLKAGYDRELRTVINEHKKVALGNLEKLKQAETALKEATISDEEIAMLSQRHERQRRLSSSSLPAIQLETKKEDREREKTLQKKLGELTTQIQRLERRIALLRTENETLKKKQDDQRPLEEKIKSLKKRNAELAAIARRLEEKAKALQQENTKVKSKSASVSSQDESGTDTEHLKRVFARQRAKDLADHAKTMLAKDKEIEQLRRKCQELADQLSNGDTMAPENAPQFEEKEELVNIIKQAAKERLQLEQQLAHAKPKQKKSEEATPTTAGNGEQNTSNDKYKQELETANQILHKEIEKLEQALHKAESLEQQLTEKSQECINLSKELTRTKEQQQELEKQLSAANTRHQQLSAQVKDLQDKVKDTEQITEECSTLKLSLAAAQKESEAAQEEVKHLNLRVHSLENLVRDLQESAEHVNILDSERQTAQQQLQQKQSELEQLQQAQSSTEHNHAQTVGDLSRQLQELEERRKQEEEKREQLSKEVERLRQESEERQKALQEAERLKAELEERQKESRAAEADLVTSQIQPALHNSPKHIGEQETEDIFSPAKFGMDRKSVNQNDRPMGESFLSAWAQKGPIQVYIAKYNYDPFEFSPNENPEAELPLTAGDYVLVVGEMDEDGFYDGELIDGRQGLVPSNFIEKVEEEDLAEFHAALMQAGHGDYSNANNNSTPTSAANTTSAIINNNFNNNNQPVFPGGRSGTAKADTENGMGGNPEESNSDLEDIAEIDEDTVSVNSRVLTNGGTINNLPPSPRSLSLDRQLTNSLLVSWRGPDPVPGLEVHSYHVVVDGQLKTSVKSSERTKALLEGISTNNTHRICVRCLSNRGQSKDAQCTMLVGKDVYPAPSELKVTHVSPTSASLSWLPGNSNYQHSIIVNGKEVRVVKPGVFRHTITGLAPGTAHKVTLIAKSISGVLNEEKSRKWVENVSASIEFHTPEAGAPEPPLNVQVESGPREGTLLVTWLPVTINSSGVCNGAVVSGYQVMADGRTVKVVPGPTSDHLVLSNEDFKGAVPSQLSVRTVSTSGIQSVDSEVVELPQSLIQEVMEGPAQAAASEKKLMVSQRGKAPRSPGGEEVRGHDTDEEIEAAFAEVQSSNDGVNAVVMDLYDDDSSCSELSDIPEVEEELIGSQDSHLNLVGTELTNQQSPYSQTDKSSPTPAPRKLAGSRGADSGPKEFHSDRPVGDRANRLAAPARVVPAIEITRDSSTEIGTSVDDEEASVPSPRTTPTSAGGKGRSPDVAISSLDRGDAQNPSAFRQVDQTRHRNSGESVRLAGTDGGDGHVHTDRADKDSKSHQPSKPQARGRDNQSPKHKSSASWSPQAISTQSPDHRKLAAVPSSSPASGLEEGGDNDSISGEINPAVDANSVRLFIALFDYDPTTMSPNVDFIDEELPFREGQILKVFGEKDADGFYKGESHGRIGYIPCNMVSEVQIDDPELVEQLLKETAERPGQTHQVTSVPALAERTVTDDQLTPNGVPSVPREGPVRKMIAMYDYDPQELSPNVDAELELSFKTGDQVTVYGDMDEDGFFMGEIDGQHGLVPSNFLQPAPSSDDDGLESASLVSAARSRSGESLDATLNALGKSESTNAPKIGDLSTSGDAPASNKQPTNANSSEGSRPGTASPADDEKPKKKGGFLNKSRNIFKKFTR